MNIPNLLSEKEKVHLNYLAEIINFGADELRDSVKTESFSYLQNFLLYSFVPVHNFSESIHILCKDSRPHAAQVLLRSIFEAYMTTEYIKSFDTEKRLALFAKDSFKNRKGFACELENFINRYPNLENELPILKRTSIVSLKEFADKHISIIENSNNIIGEQLPSFIERVKQIDCEVSVENKGKNELNYHIIYRQLSLYTHLNSWGLELFSKQDSKSVVYSLGQEKDVDHIIVYTYLYYFDLLFNLFDKKVLLGELPVKYKKWFEEMRAEM
ncbi:MAG: DUF5677 domain-containing protein [Patescibacteria group bacterium]